MNDPELLYEVRGSAAWMTINREDRRNALSLEIIDLFGTCLSRAESDELVRVVCITAAGEKAFCAGADLASSFSAADHVAGARKYEQLLLRMASFSKPLVARVSGHCLAGGLGLMLSCDMVYARDGALFGTPEVNVGLFPMMIGALLMRNVGRKKAAEMIYTAKMYSAGEAEQMGLVTRAVPAAELDPLVEKTLATIGEKAPAAIRIGRKALADAADLSLSDALDLLCDRLGAVVETEDAKEGLSAFIEKRPPQWKGR
ncbi:MAG: enoyl-CoA hydratase-related protein [Thermodesulfobacteriota bacterium]